MRGLRHLAPTRPVIAMIGGARCGSLKGAVSRITPRSGVHAAAWQQCFVCRVDHGIHILRCDVALDDSYHCHAQLLYELLYIGSFGSRSFVGHAKFEFKAY